MRKPSKTKLSLALAAALLAAGACTQDSNDRISADSDRNGPEADLNATDRTALPEPRSANPDEVIAADTVSPDAAGDSRRLVDRAVAVVNEMRTDRQAAALLKQARGIFIIPNYIQAGLVLGGEGGKGVALLKSADSGGEARGDVEIADAAIPALWSGPVFYSFGGVTAGAEAGIEVGSIAMLLMSEQAAELFRAGQTDFSIDASAGLAIFDFSARAEAATGSGDIIVWSDTAGAFAGATIGINGISQDEDDTRQYYGADVDTRTILSGELISDHAQRLRDALTTE